MRQTYRLDVEGPVSPELRKLIDSPKRPDGPAMHFHRYQSEFFHVEHGICVAEVDGVSRNLTPEDGEVSLPANRIHRFHIHPDSGEYMTVLLSGSDAGIDNQLDRVFFENWYGYWHDALLYDGGLDFIQKLQVCLSVTVKIAQTLIDHRCSMQVAIILQRQLGCRSGFSLATGPV